MPTASPSCATGRIVQAGAAEDLYLSPVTAGRRSSWAPATSCPAESPATGRDALGRFPARGANGHGCVEVLIRPEQLGLRRIRVGAGDGGLREFRGHDVFYRVRLEDGDDDLLAAALDRATCRWAPACRVKPARPCRSRS